MVEGKPVLHVPITIRRIMNRLVEQCNNTGKYPNSNLRNGRMCGIDDPDAAETNKKLRTRPVMERYGPSLELPDGTFLFPAYCKVSVPEPILKHNEVGRIRPEPAWFCHKLGTWCQRVDFFARSQAGIRVYQLVFFPLDRLVKYNDVPRPLTSDGSRIINFPNGWSLNECQELSTDHVVMIFGAMHRVAFNFQSEKGVFARPCGIGPSQQLEDKPEYSSSDWPFYFYSDFDAKKEDWNSVLMLIRNKKSEDKKHKKGKKRAGSVDPKTTSAPSSTNEAGKHRKPKSQSKPEDPVASASTASASAVSATSPSKTTPAQEQVQAWMQNNIPSLPGVQVTPSKSPLAPYVDLVHQMGGLESNLAVAQEEIRGWRDRNQSMDRKDRDRAITFSNKLAKLDKNNGKIEGISGCLETVAVQLEAVSLSVSSSLDKLTTYQENMTNTLKEGIADQFELMKAQGYFSSTSRSHSPSTSVTPKHRGPHTSDLGEHQSPFRSPRSLAALRKERHSSEDISKMGQQLVLQALKQKKYQEESPAEKSPQVHDISSDEVQQVEDPLTQSSDSDGERKEADAESGELSEFDPETKYAGLTQMNPLNSEFPQQVFNPFDPFWKSATFDDWVGVFEKVTGYDYDSGKDMALRVKRLVHAGVVASDYWNDPPKLIFKCDHILPTTEKDIPTRKGIGGKAPRKSTPAAAAAADPFEDLFEKDESSESGEPESSKKMSPKLEARKRREEEREEMLRLQKQQKDHEKKMMAAKVKGKSFFKSDPPGAAPIKKIAPTGTATSEPKPKKPKLDQKGLKLVDNPNLFGGLIPRAVAVKKGKSTPKIVATPKPKQVAHAAAAAKRAATPATSDDDLGMYPFDAKYKRHPDEKSQGELATHLDYSDNLVQHWMPPRWVEVHVSKLLSYNKLFFSNLSFVKSLALRMVNFVISEQKCVDVRGPMDMHNHYLRAVEVMKNKDGFRLQTKLLKPIYPLYAIVERAMAARNIVGEDRETAIKAIVVHIGHNLSNKDWKQRAKKKKTE